VPPQVRAEAGQAADQVELRESWPFAACEAAGGRGKALAGEHGDCFVEGQLRVAVSGLAGRVQGEGERRSTVVEAGVAARGQRVAGCLG
jgi:hypothetical protein